MTANHNMTSKSFELGPRNIWAVGRNYSDHAKEMNSPVPKEPMIFLKSGACLVKTHEVPLDPELFPIHHEIEVAIKIDSHFQASEIALALDLTARAEQTRAKSEGLPWTLAKSFRNSCPISDFISVPNELPEIRFELFVNGESRQRGSTHNMIFSAAEIIAFLRSKFPLEPGDIILTGTPSGVGPLNPGDSVSATATSSLGHEIKKTWSFVSF